MKNYYDKTWKIGELARVFNINVQLLRHYDKEGLLTPDIRNPENKWRTYRYDNNRDWGWSDISMLRRSRVDKKDGAYRVYLPKVERIDEDEDDDIIDDEED